MLGVIIKGCSIPRFGRKSSAITSKTFLAVEGAGGYGECGIAALTDTSEYVLPASLYFRWQQPGYFKTKILM